MNEMFTSTLSQISEEWRIIPGFPKYSASSLGRIRRDVGGKGVRAGRMKHPSSVEKKYLITRLMGADGQVWSRRVHILVALAFLGPKPTPKHHVNHKNGDRNDNCLENLEYLTKPENERHKAENGLAAWGEKHGMHKLTAAQVYVIRASSETWVTLAARYGVSKHTIFQVKGRRTWRHLPEAA